MTRRRIGLISDTHGLVRPEALRALKGVEAIIQEMRRDTSTRQTAAPDLPASGTTTVRTGHVHGGSAS